MLGDFSLLIPSAISISFKLYTTMDENSNQDYFSYLLESKFERGVSLFISITVLILGPPMLFTIVWFENFGSDKKRTFLNRLVAMNCWTGNKTRLLFLNLLSLKYWHPKREGDFKFEKKIKFKYFLKRFILNSFKFIFNFFWANQKKILCDL